MRQTDAAHLSTLTAAFATAVLVALPTAVADDLRIADSSLTTEDPTAVGDPLTYTVELEHPVDVELDLSSPPEGSRWSEIDRHLDTSTSGDTATTRATVDYAVFRPGPTTGPPVDLLANGEPSGLDTPHYDLHVAAVTDDDASLGKPRSPWPMWSEHRTLFWLSLGAVGFGLFAVVGALALRRRRYDEVRTPAPPPHVTALEALERLADDFPCTDQAFKAFYFALSHVIRRYLGQRFGFPGAELTTTELVDKLRKVDHPELSVDEIARWLRACDRVKFAGHLPEAERAREHLNRAFDFIDSTKPEPPESPETVDPQAEDTE